MRTISQITGLAAIALLSACGGGGTSGGATVFDIQTGAAPPTYNPNNGVLSLNGLPIASRSDNPLARRGQASVTNAPGSEIYQARVENGNVFAVTYDDISGDSGTIYGRRDAADVSGGGTARFVGDYVGLSIRNPDGAGSSDPGFSAGVLGGVALDANFDRETISGQISGRYTVNALGNPFTNPVGANNVSFRDAQLRADGSFRAPTTGGTFTQSGAVFTTEGGQIEGFIGENFGGFGSSAAGTFTMDHEKNGTILYRETGVFVAAESTSPFE